MTAVRRVTEGVTYRGATEADVEAEHAVFVAAEGELLARHGFGWTEPPPVARIGPTLCHLLAHDRERCFVAEADGRVVGYSAVWVRGATAFLAALFIDPAFQGRGVGRRLMELAFAGAPANRLTISDAIQPVSNALYARAGLLPLTPILGFRGEPTLALPADPDPADLEPAAPTGAALAMLDLAAYGFDRAVDHAFWATQAAPTLWVRAGEPVAYSYRGPTGRIGPIAGRDPSGAADALRAELGRAPAVYVEIPGTSRALVHVALAAGLRLTAPPGLLLMTDGVTPPSAVAISGYGLM